jgi:cysteine desulfurase
MAANNVTGTLQPIAQCGAIAQEHGVRFHVDAVQATGKVPLDVLRDHIDLLSMSAHKIYGPKGIGALYVRDGLSLHPLLEGGGQEAGLRSGTENVAGIVALGAAADICAHEMSAESASLVQLRDRLIQAVLALDPRAYLIGHRYRRLPGLASFGFAGLEGEAMRTMLSLDEEGIAVSTGSACSLRHDAGPSYVLTALGFDPLRARGSLRVSMGRFNTRSDVDRFVQVLGQILARLTPITSRAS